MSTYCRVADRGTEEERLAAVREAYAKDDAEDSDAALEKAVGAVLSGGYASYRGRIIWRPGQDKRV